MTGQRKGLIVLAIAFAILAGSGVYFYNEHGALANSNDSGHRIGPLVASHDQPVTVTAGDGHGGVTAPLRNATPDGLNRSYAPPVGNALEVISALQPLAQAGDEGAAFSIYLKIDACRHRVYEDDRMGENNSSSISEVNSAMFQRLASELEECDGLTQELYDSAGKWLEQAADQGLLVAQLTYAVNPEAIVGPGANMLSDPSSVERYKSKAMNYLATAAGQGSIDAMVRLGGAYKNGIMIKRDLVKSYGYYYASRQINPGAVSQEFLNRLEKEMTATQLSDGILKGRVIYDSCCTN